MTSRSRRVRSLGWAPFSLILLAVGAGVSTLPAQAARAVTEAPTVSSVSLIGFTVADLDRSVAFYTETFGFVVENTHETADTLYDRLEGVFASRVRFARLRLGTERIELTQFLTPQGRPVPQDSRSNDRWFQHIAIVVSDIDSAYRVLRGRNVAHVSPAPQRLPDWNPNAGGISAFYFRDPDGHVLEIIHFPLGKGDPRWRAAAGRLFLGIDHTAIVVGSTETSRMFYRDLLGLRVAGESENFGPEQERLNAVFGAHLLITGLRAPAGPGVEFLHYLSPSDGRPMPLDERAPDLFHWQTTVSTTDLEGLQARLLAAGARLVSPGIVTVTDPAYGFRRGLLVRDPDGHVLRIVEPN